MGSQCLIELEDGMGAKMTIRLAGGSATDWMALTHEFWGRTR